VDILSSSPR